MNTPSKMNKPRKMPLKRGFCDAFVTKLEFQSFHIRR